MSKFHLDDYVRMTGRGLAYAAQNVPPAFLRISSLGSAALALSSAGEVAVRITQAIGISKINEWTNGFFTWTRRHGVECRPMQNLDNRTLVVTFVATTLFSLAAWQGANMLFGAPSSAYNDLLSKFTYLRVV